MQIIKGKQYIMGAVSISDKALEALAALGVIPLRSPINGEAYGSFFLPEGHDGSEFKHYRGDIWNPGKFTLAIE